MRNSRLRTTIAAFGIILGFGLWIMLKPGGETLAARFSNIASPTAGFCAAVACLYAGRRGTGLIRRGWTLIGAGMACTATGDSIWGWYEMVLHAEVPAVSIADIAYLLQVPLTLAGIAALIATRRSADTVRTLLDGLIIAGSFLYLSWAAVLGAVFRSGGENALERAVLLGYPIGDVATASMVFIMLGHVDRSLRPALSLAGAGLLALALADSVYAYLAQHDNYGSGDLVDVAWFAAFVLIGLAGLRAAQGGAPAVRADVQDPWKLVTLPYVPLACALCASVIVQTVRGTIEPFLYADTILLVLLVVARQVATLRDNARLTRRLESSVQDLQMREEQLRHLAFHDPLTGLANRALFHDRVQHAIAGQAREATSIGVLYIDLDGFKAVNDLRGHAAGDLVLATVGRRLQECARPSDTVARLGGDEFAVLLEHLSEAGSAESLAQRIVDVVAEAIDFADTQITVGASVGIAVREPGGDSVSEVLRAADFAMYAAKLQGKGRYVTFESHMRAAFAAA